MNLKEVEFGEVLMWIGSVMIAIGVVGLIVYGLIAAFTISLPLGLVCTILAGFLVGMIGVSIVN